MKKYQRVVALVFVFALVAVACGDDDTATTATTAATTTTSATTTTGVPFVGRSFAAENCDYGGKIASIEATAETEVVFTLCSEDPAFLAKLAFIPFAVQPAEHLEATGGSPLENPVGTGPFVLDELTQQRDVRNLP